MLLVCGASESECLTIKNRHEMTFEELLKLCAGGEMPMVMFQKKECQVLTIKKGDGYYGCGVDIPGVPYVVWFNAEPGTDGRKKYMSELTPCVGKTAS